MPKLAAVLVTLAILAAPVAAVTQPVPTQPVPPGVEVERVTIAPEDAIVFTLAPGNNHRLLRIKARGEAAANATLGQGEIRVSMSGTVEGATLSVENQTAQALGYSILADYDGNGGYVEVGTRNVAASGTDAFAFDRAVAQVRAFFDRIETMGDSRGA